MAAVNVMAIPIGIIIAIVLVIVAWKIFKFTLKKISAVIQGLAALALIGYVLIANPIDLTIAFGLAGLGILFGAISNVFS